MLEILLNSISSLFSANRLYVDALPWLKQQLGGVGLRVIQTFDSHSEQFPPCQPEITLIDFRPGLYDSMRKSKVAR